MQLALDLEITASYNHEDFIVSSSNEEAYSWVVRGVENFIHPFLNIYGAPKCGKTHLAHIWARKCHAGFFNDSEFEKMDVEEISARASNLVFIAKSTNFLSNHEDEDKLFHLLNLLKENYQHMLIISEIPVSKWQVNLPDLSSRLKAIPTVLLGTPDEELLYGVLIKRFMDKGIMVSPEVARYILSRSARTFQDISNIVEHIDSAALQQKRDITIPFIKTIFDVLSCSDRLDTQPFGYPN